MMVHTALSVMLLVADVGPAGRLAEPQSAYVPAPVPDPSFDLPRPRAKKRVELVPALTDTQAYVPVGNGYSPGSAFSREMARRSQPQTAIGNQLAPGLSLRIPLQ
jgi:hypothetical protein